MGNNFIISSSPHIRSGNSTEKIMTDVVIALLPATMAGVYFFGFNAAAVILVSLLSCILSEYLSSKILKRGNTLSDFSAVVTGLLLALNMPPSVPLWIVAVGGFIAIVIVKQIFGGIGQNFMNPAMAARVILLVSWPAQMTTWVNPRTDVTSSATPLALIKKGKEAADAALPSYMDLLWGNVAGCIGETSVIALLIGAAYLVARRVISLEIPLSLIGTVALFTWIFGGDTLFSGNALYHVMAGGLILAAFFMATDYTTSPVTWKGRLIMGIGCGIITSVIRLYTGYAEGVSFGILIMNVAVPLIDRFSVPKSFGGEKIHA